MPQDAEKLLPLSLREPIKEVRVVAAYSPVVSRDRFESSHLTSGKR
jgi:hypothetical protein